MLDLPRRAQRSQTIDLLRAVLACWVLVAHLIPWTELTQGADAVPVVARRFSSAAIRLFQPCGETNPAVLAFIVLSGYCIHRNGWRRAGGSLPTYVVRRAFRIYPVYLLATLAGIAAFLVSTALAAEQAAILTGTSRISLPALLGKLVGVSVFYPPWHLATCLGNAPLHTVMVEMWLYVLYPLAIVQLAARWSERALWSGLFLVWLGGILLITRWPGLAGWWHHGSLAGFVLYWWIGAKCVDLTFVARVQRLAVPLLAVWAGLTLLLLWPGIGGAPVVELRKLVFACLVGVAVARIDDKALPGLGWLDPAGKAGYSLYAYHAPITYTLLLAGVRWWLIAPIAVAAGMILFRLYENPFIQLGKRCVPTASSPRQTTTVRAA
jgi:peptidoglycan/LPS O-acetylase OafA/YrhL